MPVTVRELDSGETHLATRTLLELRPALGEPEALAKHIDERLRPTGYRLIGAFASDNEEAAAVAGFRINEFLAWGKHLYVDDFVTAEGHRGRGLADRLFAWLEDEARQLRVHPVPSRLGRRRGPRGRPPVLLPARAADHRPPLPPGAVNDGGPPKGPPMTRTSRAR